MRIDYVAVHAELTKIANQSEAQIASPSAIVERARDPKSILHPYFTWDDGEAAELYRLAEAERLVRRVKFQVVRASDDDNKPAEIVVTRAFQSNPLLRRDGTGSYQPTETIMADPQSRDALLQSALSELRGVRRRYEQLRELSEVWNAIDRVSEEPKPKKGKRQAS